MNEQKNLISRRSNFQDPQALLCGQAGFDVAQTPAVAQLRERHGAKLILTGEAFDLAVASVALHAATETVLGDMLQRLSEDEFA